MIAQLVCAGLVALVACLFIGWPRSNVWHWMLIGALGNSSAILLLSAAYRRGDYAVTYGLSRATVPWLLKPLTVLLLGAVLAGALVYSVAQPALNAFVGGLIYRFRSGISITVTQKTHGRVGAARSYVSTASYLLILWVFTLPPPVVVRRFVTQACFLCSSLALCFFSSGLAARTGSAAGS